MYRLRLALLTACLAGIISGCGEDQPNSARPEQVTPDFAKDSAGMMQKANTGMDPKQMDPTKQAKDTVPPAKK